MHNYNYVNTLWFGSVSFDRCSRFILCLYCFVYYVYDNPTYEVANKLICILYLVITPVIQTLANYVGDGALNLINKQCSH